MPNTILAARCCGVATLAVLASLALVAAPIHTAHSQGARLSLPVTVDNTATNPVPSTVVNPADIAKA